MDTGVNETEELKKIGILYILSKIKACVEYNLIMKELINTNLSYSIDFIGSTQPLLKNLSSLFIDSPQGEKGLIITKKNEFQEIPAININTFNVTNRSIQPLTANIAQKLKYTIETPINQFHPYGFLKGMIKPADLLFDNLQNVSNNYACNENKDQSNIGMIFNDPVLKQKVDNIKLLETVEPSDTIKSTMLETFKKIVDALLGAGIIAAQVATDVKGIVDGPFPGSLLCKAQLYAFTHNTDIDNFSKEYLGCYSATDKTDFKKISAIYDICRYLLQYLTVPLLLLMDRYRLNIYLNLNINQNSFYGNRITSSEFFSRGSNAFSTDFGVQDQIYNSIVNLFRKPIGINYNLDTFTGSMSTGVARLFNSLADIISLPNETYKYIKTMSFSSKPTNGKYLFFCLNDKNLPVLCYSISENIVRRIYSHIDRDSTLYKKFIETFSTQVTNGSIIGVSSLINDDLSKYAAITPSPSKINQLTLENDTKNKVFHCPNYYNEIYVLLRDTLPLPFGDIFISYFYGTTKKYDIPNESGQQVPFSIQSKIHTDTKLQFITCKMCGTRTRNMDSRFKVGICNTLCQKKYYTLVKKNLQKQ